MNELYPLKFTPIFKERIWGGHKINTKLGMDFSPLPNCGEAWVLSGVGGSQTAVANGFLQGNELNELLEIYMDDLVGESVFEKFGEEFPILVKFLDSTDHLSIQVHPDDVLARKRGLSQGKTEMWYIMDADPGATLISGFNRKMDRDTYLKHMNEKSLPEILNIEKVSKGDVFYIPGGRIHALGPGLLLAEIQQTSDTTYRIYDWDRVDNKGNPRELHTELALDAIDYTYHDSVRSHYRKVENAAAPMVESSYFTTNLLDLTQPVHFDYGHMDTFIIYVCVEGSALVKTDDHKETIVAGETMLIPAILKNVDIIPDGRCKLLEVYVP